MNGKVKFVILVIVALFVSGCAGSSDLMRTVSDQEASYTPGENQSMIVFMRPSTLGFAIQSSVFDVTTGENAFVGVVSAKKKVVHQAAPGEHMFMVVGESADFMKADLAPGKTYYVLVTPRLGLMKARFSLRPVARAEIGSEEFDKWAADCEYTENTDAAFEWARRHAPSIQSKRVKYLEDWNEKPDSKKPVLAREDGAP